MSLPPLGLNVAKKTTVVVAAKLLAEVVLEDALEDAKLSQDSFATAKTMMDLVASIRTNPTTEVFNELMVKTLESCTELATTIETDIHELTPPNDAPLSIFYKSLVFALADLYPGQIPVPEDMTPDEFYGIVVENRNQLLKLAGLKYTNK